MKNASLLNTLETLENSNLYNHILQKLQKNSSLKICNFSFEYILLYNSTIDDSKDFFEMNNESRNLINFQYLSCSYQNFQILSINTNKDNNSNSINYDLKKKNEELIMKILELESNLINEKFLSDLGKKENKLKSDKLEKLTAYVTKIKNQIKGI